MDDFGKSLKEAWTLVLKNKKIIILPLVSGFIVILLMLTLSLVTDTYSLQKASIEENARVRQAIFSALLGKPVESDPPVSEVFEPSNKVIERYKTHLPIVILIGAIAISVVFTSTILWWGALARVVNRKKIRWSELFREVPRTAWVLIRSMTVVMSILMLCGFASLIVLLVVVGLSDFLLAKFAPKAVVVGISLMFAFLWFFLVVLGELYLIFRSVFVIPRVFLFREGPIESLKASYATTKPIFATLVFVLIFYGLTILTMPVNFTLNFLQERLMFFPLSFTGIVSIVFFVPLSMVFAWFHTFLYTFLFIVAAKRQSAFRKDA